MIHGTKRIDSKPFRKWELKKSAEIKENLIIKAQVLCAEVLGKASMDVNEEAQIKVEDYLVRNILKGESTILFPRRYVRQGSDCEKALATDVLKEIAVHLIEHTTEGRQFIETLERIIRDARA